MEIVGCLLIRFIAAGLAASIGSQKGKSVGLYFTLAVLLSPLIMIIVGLCAKEEFVYYCPKCSSIAYFEGTNSQSNCWNCKGEPMKCSGVRADQFRKKSEEARKKTVEGWKKAKVELIVEETPEKYEPTKDEIKAAAEKFSCRSCKKKMSGWYKECPECGGLNTIVLTKDL